MTDRNWTTISELDEQMVAFTATIDDGGSAMPVTGRAYFCTAADAQLPYDCLAVHPYTIDGLEVEQFDRIDEFEYSVYELPEDLRLIDEPIA